MCWHCIRRELFILHTTLRTVTDVKRRYTKHCVNKMADSSGPGKFLMLLTLERSSFRENATLQATFFHEIYLSGFKRALERSSNAQTAQKKSGQTDKQTDSRTLYPSCACARTGEAHARARGNNMYMNTKFIIHSKY